MVTGRSGRAMARRMLRVKRLTPAAILPGYAHPGDSGLDLCASEHTVIPAGRVCAVATGIAIQLPPGCEGQVRPRSGLALKAGITVLNAPGTIDNGYRGELRLILVNHGRHAFRVEPGMKLAQLVVAPVLRVAVREVRGMTDTSRGTGGFGSTGLHHAGKGKGRRRG